MTAKRRSPRSGGSRNGAIFAGVLAVLIAGAYGIFVLVNNDAPPRKRVMETIALKIIPPPPPPPPPPTPPPPPKMVEEQKIQEPTNKPDDAPKDDSPPPLAADLGASQGPCSGACVETSGRDPSYRPPTVGGGGGGRANYTRYASLMQDRIGRRIHEDDKLNFARFRATIRIWLTDGGKVDRVEVTGTTGNDDFDDRIRKMIGTMPALPEAPPKDMPQPVIVRIGATPGFG